MNFDPQKLFIGLMDFFSILLPGTLLTCLLMGEVGPVVLEDWYSTLDGAEAWAAFLFASYIFGHLVFLLGSWLDAFYDVLRRYPLNMVIKVIIRLGDILIHAADDDLLHEATGLENYNDWVQAEREFRLCRSLRVALRETETLSVNWPARSAPGIGRPYCNRYKPSGHGRRSGVFHQAVIPRLGQHRKERYAGRSNARRGQKSDRRVQRNAAQRAATAHPAGDGAICGCVENVRVSTQNFETSPVERILLDLSTLVVREARRETAQTT